MLYQSYPEQRLAVLAHESLHANTPLNSDNDHLFGGEANRKAAETLAWTVMRQSLATKTHLNSYHKSLIEQRKAGKIDDETLAEETWAIMGEMALTDRNGLLGVQERQHQIMDDYNRIEIRQGRIPLEKVALVSQEGSSTLSGVDTALAKLIDGIATPRDLIAHVHNMKDNSYSRHNMATVVEREAMRGYDHEEYIDTLVQEQSLVVPAMVAYIESFNLKRYDSVDDEDEAELKRAA